MNMATVRKCKVGATLANLADPEMLYGNIRPSKDMQIQLTY